LNKKAILASLALIFLMGVMVQEAYALQFAKWKAEVKPATVTRGQPMTFTVECFLLFPKTFSITSYKVNETWTGGSSDVTSFFPLVTRTVSRGLESIINKTWNCNPGAALGVHTFYCTFVTSTGTFNVDASCNIVD
jgi:hypothetical protein